MLADKLGIGVKGVISLVGAGGKTSTMLRLAAELSINRRVIITTTTKILCSEVKDSGDLIISDDFAILRDSLKSKPSQLVTVAKGINKAEKLIGIDPAWIDYLTKENELEYDLIIVEADGAARKDFKIPNSTEPVLPQSTDLLLPIVGSRIVGKEATTEYLHRAYLLKDINFQFRNGDPITPELIVEILLSPAGYNLLHRQKECSVVPLINQVDRKDRYNSALEIAERLISAGIERVLLTSVQSQNPVVEVIE